MAFWKPKKNSVIIKIWQVNLATWQAPNARPGGQIGVISPQIPRTVIEAMSEKTPMSRGGRCGCGPVGQAVASAEDSQTFSQHQSGCSIQTTVHGRNGMWECEFNTNA